MQDIDFEEHIEKSKQILQKLMDPKLKLEDGVKFYKEGLKELNEAKELLEKAELTIKEYQKGQEER